MRPFFRGQPQAKLVSRDGAPGHFVADEAGRHEVMAQTSGIEPFLQCGHRSVVIEHAAVPHALERRHFVKAGALSGLQREVRIGSTDTDIMSARFG